MRKLLHIIDENLGAKDFPMSHFNGNVYFQGNNKRLNLDKSDYKKLLDEFNVALENSRDSLTKNEDLLAVFISKIVVDNSQRTTGGGRRYYKSSIIINTGLISLSSEETTANDKIPDSVIYLSWDDIDAVKLIESTNKEESHYFRFFEKNNKIYHDLVIDRFGTVSLIAAKSILNLLNEIIEFKNNTTANHIDEHVELQSKIEKLFNDENYEEGVEELDNFSKIYNINDITLDDSSFYYFNKIFGLRSMGRFEDALKTIDSYIDRYKAVGEIEPYTYELKGQVLTKLKRYLSAINCYAISEENYENYEYAKGVRLKKEEVYSKLKKKFLDVSYIDRKIVFVAEELYSTISEGIVVLKKNKIPKSIAFTIGHPIINNTYICHPYKQNLYLPLKDYSNLLFLERIQEFTILLEALGATHIDISNRGEAIKASKKILEQDFTPTKAPNIPTNLIWYPLDLSWQKLANQRLKDGVKMYTEVITTLDVELISSNEIEQINTDLKVLLPKSGIKYTKSHIISQSNFNKQDCIVEVIFEDLNKLESVNNSDAELGLKKYEEDVVFMLEDGGDINATERKILNRKIKKYGISKVDALAVETKLLNSNYSENEKKYIEELKDLLNDGDISDIERKILNRYALKFKVSLDRQEQIDAVFII